MFFVLSLFVVLPYPFLIGRSPLLTIELDPKFGFNHRTPKSGIFDHPTIKTVCLAIQ
jgi:hypothetical protein